MVNLYNILGTLQSLSKYSAKQKELQVLISSHMRNHMYARVEHKNHYFPNYKQTHEDRLRLDSFRTDLSTYRHFGCAQKFQQSF